LLAWGARSDGVLHAANKITIQTHAIGKRKRDMGMILLEALAAGGILVLIVWWTMFSGRDKGELKKPDPPDGVIMEGSHAPDSTTQRQI
jgi:hypothetical protein